MRFKDDRVNSNGIRPELVLALVIADQVYNDNGKNLVITSLNDSQHSKTSLHYSGAAADLRINYFTKSQSMKVVRDLRTRLNADYDVVLEENHIHLEFQPKRR